MTNVLVVDDSEVDLRLVKGLLEKEQGLAVDTATSGEAALDIVARSLPDVVVTDLEMPGMDGLALVAAMRHKHPLVPVVLMTSKGNENTAVEALRRGAASYVPKRQLADELPDTIRNLAEAADRRRGERRLMNFCTSTESRFALENDGSLIPPLVGLVQDEVARRGLCDESESLRVGVALGEALSNALFHGNLEISSQLREDDFRAYRSLVAERMGQSPFRERRVHVTAQLSPREVTLIVRDEGQGFDPATLPDPTDPANLERITGRGVLLMRTFMDEVSFNKRGTEVTLVKRPTRKKKNQPMADATSPG
jgi:CheY-like chemotaxis protein